ncbi:MAG: tetraacyldisaccharide 4'-kinase [Alphaproteobacteria bacterium]
MLKSPAFWHKKSSLAAIVLSPLGFLYGVVASIKQRVSRPQKLGVPVLCIGNAVLGGAGKTPTAIAIARMLQSSGHTPHILTRGYGRRSRALLRVDPNLHNFADVGDEPLLLGSNAPTWVYHDRASAGKQAIAAGATILMMDDGYQNTQIVKDRHLLVVDAAQGIGNGKVFPAGPLREFLGAALLRADAIVMIGEGDCRLPYDGPVFRAHLVPQSTTFAANTEVVAFAGIGYPPKFQKTLEGIPLSIKQFVSFPDHHPYKARDIEPLLAIGLPLITTEKDWLRLPTIYQPHVHVLKVELQMTDPVAFQKWLEMRFPFSIT